MKGKLKDALVGLATYVVGTYLFLAVSDVIINLKDQSVLGWTTFVVFCCALVAAMYQMRKASHRLFLEGKKKNGRLG